MAHRQAYEVLLPRMPLGELFDGHVASQLIARGIEIHRGTTVQTITTRGQQFNLLIENNSQTFDQVIVAVPWRAIRGVLDNAIQSQLPWISTVEKLPSSPITGIHLWFDRPITNEPHAVLVGRLSQWLFSRGVDTTTIGDQSSHYYQVVISASRMLQQQDRTQIVNQVVTELSSIWPATREARLLRSRVVTEPNAVFARNAQTEGARPHAATPVPGLFVAGDWTNTDWPATMEGAVRSGYFAARTALQSIGEAPSPWSHVPDLPRGKLAQWLCGPQ
jgi:protoporphyrinogen oxidase